MKVVFFGTPDIAVHSLQALIEDKVEVRAVVTRPDRPKGRGLHLTAPPVKVLAEQKGIEVLQPPKTADPKFVERIREIGPDLIVCVAYGGFLVRSILDIPPLGSINLHPSLLPKYRGASPVQWAVIRGESKTGVTIFYIGEGMDNGDVILQREVQIQPEENSEVLFNRLIPVGVTLLLEAVRLINQKKAKSIKQNDQEATFAPKITKEDGLIDWKMKGMEIVNRVCGLLPWPVAFTFILLHDRWQEFRVFKANWEKEKVSASPGKVLSCEDNVLRIACADGVIIPMEVQLEGKRRMSIADFMRGHAIVPGTVLASHGKQVVS